MSFISKLLLYAVFVELIVAWAVVTCGSEGTQGDHEMTEQPTRDHPDWRIPSRVIMTRRMDRRRPPPPDTGLTLVVGNRASDDLTKRGEP